MNAPMPQGQPPAPPPPPPAAAPDQGQGKKIVITVNNDGTFDVDGVPAQSPEEAIKAVSDSIGVDAGSNQDQAGDLGAEPNPDAAGDAGAPGADNMDAAGDAAPVSDEEAKAQYAKKRGTRPKIAPSWGDYLTGGNPTAK